MEAASEDVLCIQSCHISKNLLKQREQAPVCRGVCISNVETAPFNHIHIAITLKM